MSENQVDRIIITVDDQHLSEIQTVASACKAEGMRVDNVLSVTGIITGEISKVSLSKIESITGVANVEPDGEAFAI